MIALLTALACQPEAVQAERSAGGGADVSFDAPYIEFEDQGLRVESQTWSTKDDAGRAWRVALPASARLRVVPSPHVAAFSALAASDERTWAAINGGFYKDDRAMGLVVSNGDQRSALAPRGGSGVVETRDFGLAIVHRDAWEVGPSDALQSIDRLVDAHQSLVHAREGAPRAARSAVALSDSTVWLVVVASESSIEPVDGGVQLRRTSGAGMSLAAFADYLIRSTDAETALNLDGAVSTQLIATAGPARLEVRGERGTINALLLTPR